MRILLFGCNGQVGWELQRSLATLGEVIALDFDSKSLSADFSRPDTLAATVRSVLPDVVVNAAAHTAVDKAEAEPDLARTINAEAPGVLAREAAISNAWLVHYSTDYVFDGSGNRPRLEDDPTGPLSVYGRTKLEAEELVMTLPRCAVVRITNAFDIGFDDRNFVHRCVTSFRDGKPLIVPSDQFATPMYATWLAEQCVTLWIRGAILCPDSPKLLHAGCDDLVSRGELARRVARRLGADAGLIEERPTAALSQAAPRPLRGGLRNDRWKRLLGVGRLPLDDALDDCLPRMKELYAAVP